MGLRDSCDGKGRARHAREFRVASDGGVSGAVAAGRGGDETRRGDANAADVAGRTAACAAARGGSQRHRERRSAAPTLRCSPADDEGRRTTPLPVFRGGCRLGEVGDEDATTRRSRARGRRKRYLTRGSLEGGGGGERVARVAGRAEARAVRVSDRPEKNAPGAVSFPPDQDDDEFANARVARRKSRRRYPPRRRSPRRARHGDGDRAVRARGVPPHDSRASRASWARDVDTSGGVRRVVG